MTVTGDLLHSEATHSMTGMERWENQEFIEAFPNNKLFVSDPTMFLLQTFPLINLDKPSTER